MMKIERRLIEVIVLLVLYRNKCVFGKITSACAPEGHLTRNPRGTMQIESNCVKDTAKIEYKNQLDFFCEILVH